MMALGKVAVARRQGADGKLQDVKVPDHLEIIANLARGAVARLRFSAIAAFGPANEAWIYGSDGTLRLEADARKLWLARRGDKALAEVPIPAEQRIGWRVEEEFVNAIRGREKIQLTSQMPSARLAEFLGQGVLYNACSLHQLEQYGRLAPGRDVAVRMNAGLGSGSTKRTNTGGPAASFGIWHEYLGDVKTLADKHSLRITRLHSHIGSGTDPEVWKRVTRMTLDLVAKLGDVAAVNLGGGFKVGRMPGEPSTDLQDIGEHVTRELMAFRDRDGRALHLEVEPGTYLVATSGYVVATCIDVVDTGRDGYLFAKLDTGMPEVTRPSLYGAQHPIDVLATGRDQADVVFVGPCCESGDILTPAPGDPEALAPRRVPRPQIGDLVIVAGAGAYCAAMSTINYNSYPQAPEVMLEPDGSLRLLRRRQSPDQVWQNEV